MTPEEASTRDSSSTARIASKNLAPPPPYCSGISMPIRPSWKNSWMRSLSKTPFSSISFDQRTDLLVGELADVVAEENFVFGERGQRSGGSGLQRGFGHNRNFSTAAKGGSAGQRPAMKT
jgi:hypothetical protein